MNIKNREIFQKLIRDSFQFKRKTLRNNLKGYPLDKIELILKKYGHDLSSRAEVLSVIEFVEISNSLEQKNLIYKVSNNYKKKAQVLMGEAYAF